MFRTRLATRFAQTAATVPRARRSYSYFSQKPGGGNGRFFNSSKAPKVPPATRSGSSPTSATVSSVSKSADSDTSSTKVIPEAELAESSPSQSSSSSTPSVSQSQSTILSSILSSEPVSPHPNPELPTLHLHNFFSEHRPLLLLDQPLAQLFRTAPASDISTLSFSPTAPPTLAPTPANPAEQSTMEEWEADADTARTLARAMVQHKVNAGQEWDVTLERLGLKAESGSIEDVVSLDSVKRKRRKKITKHKYKKRRKAQRAERRRLGK